YGMMPGGFVLASAINSAVTNRWVSPAGFEWFHFLLAATLGMTGAVVLTANLFTIFVVVVSLAYTLAGFGLFSYWDVAFPWVGCLFNFLVVGLAVYNEKLRVFDARTRALKVSLGGSLPGKRMADII